MAGCHVLDVACGSGLVAIAAAIAGAAKITANEIDPYSIAAINAHANGVESLATAECSRVPVEDGGADYAAYDA